MPRSILLLLILAALFISLPGCQKNNQDDPAKEPRFYSPDEFVMGADLSYVNQILDHGGTYRDSGKIKDPYRIFADHSANVVRLRLFHPPRWTGEIYGEGTRPGSAATSRHNGVQVQHGSTMPYLISREIPYRVWIT